MSRLPVVSDASVLAGMLHATGAMCALYRPEHSDWVLTPGVFRALGDPDPSWVCWQEKEWLEVVHREDSESFLAVLRGVAPGKSMVRLRAQDGGWRKFSLSYESGLLSQPLLVLEDVTAKSQMESALHDSQTRLNSLYDTAPVAIILWSREGRITGWNSTAEASLGHPREAVMGQKLVPLLIEPSDFEPFSAGVKAAIAGAPRDDLIFKTRRQDGRILECLWRSVPLRTRKGALTGIFSLVLDVTAERAAAARMHQAKESAERLSRAKSEFMAVVGHELRTPLNGIIGMTQILQALVEGEDEQTYLQTLFESGEGLLNIVNAIMRYAEADLVTPQELNREFSPFELFATYVQPFELQAKRKHLKFGFHFDHDLPDPVYGDEEGIKQILSHLLANAIRFTDQGGVELSVSRNPEVSNTSDLPLLIEVKDSGVGMSEAFMSELYTPFRQAESALTRKQGGVGLGLALVRKLVDRQAGRISVVSTPGEGTVFRVALNLRLQPLPPDAD